jgi:hypothetical protein
MTEINPIASFPYNDLDIIKSVIGATFFADYGIISQVNDDDTINVTHSALAVLINGTVLPKTETYNVEVLYPASAAFGQKWPLAVGDGVLLIGLKNYVETTNGIAEPEEAPTSFPHYTQNTMKAIPLQSVTAPKVTIVVNGTDLELVNSNSGGKFKIANTSKSLETVLENLINHISNLVTLPCSNGSPTSLNPATQANLAQDIADMKLLLKA